VPHGGKFPTYVYDRLILLGKNKLMSWAQSMLVEIGTHGDGAPMKVEENLIGMAKGVISALALIILCQVYMIF